ncbi:MAG TPA: hypothetical protein VFP61_15250 [Acidimicrobiales bacterium]|nr:hypothetical protein [Acidimicrobiales bacterium]
MAASGFGSLRHLASRFVGALSPAGPAAADERWALEQLLDGERQLWRQMSGPDRRHAVGVARDAIGRLGPDAPARPVVAAALLHDVGKVDSRLGTFARVGVTVAALAVGRDRLLSRTGDAASAGSRSPRRRAGAYLVHDRIGAELLDAAGADPLTVAWAREHHLPAERWTLDHRVAEALKAADGD